MVSVAATTAIAIVAFALGYRLSRVDTSSSPFQATVPAQLITKQNSDPDKSSVDNDEVKFVGLNETCGGLPGWVFKLKEQKIFSQYGEDGVTVGLVENLKEHINNKYYVEFGTQDGKECNTRVLRERHGWKGLLMDGGYDIPEIGLHKEIIMASNVVELFEKYNVPKDEDGFDLFSEDTDMSDYYIWKAVLEAGYRPKILISEVNSNFQQTEAATTHPPPEGGVRFWTGDAYMGVSALGLRYLWNRHGYTMVQCTMKTVNCFGVRNDLLGIAPKQAKSVQECLWRAKVMGSKLPIHSCPMPFNRNNTIYGGFVRETWSLIGEDGEIVHHDYRPYFTQLSESCWAQDMKLLIENGAKPPGMAKYLKWKGK